MKKKSQSQRKTPSKILYERNMPKNNKYSYLNSFRQTKDSRYFLSTKDNIKKKLISNQDSPRTIDYMQVMQKYEHLIEQNSENKKNEKENYFETDYNVKQNNLMNNNLINFCGTDDNNNNNKTDGINNIIYLDYEKGKNKSYKNIRNFFSDKIEMDKNKMNNFYDKNEEYKKINNTCKITKKNISFNSQSFNNLNNIKTNINQNDFYKKYNNNKSFSFFQGLLNKENNNETKTQELIKNNNIFKEKIKPIISLCQKYAKIMSNSINFIEVNSVNNSTDIYIELKNIIKQYNKFIFSEKIKNFIFNQDSIQKNDFLRKNTKNVNNFNLKEFEPKNLNFTEKFRSKISALKNEKCKIYGELNDCKKKNKFLVLEKDEMEIEINKLKRENEELKSKIKNLENIEKEYLLQNNENNKLKGQIENLNIDIKYKENIINNLQQILEQIKLNSNIINTNYNRNNITKNNTKIENNKQNNESGFLSDINNDSIEKDIIAPCNLKVNSIIENILNLDEDDDNNKKDIKNIKINNNEEEQKKINKKMEKIDQDILDLKTKLKKIYSK